MLPDYPVIKEKLQQFLDRRLQVSIRRFLGPLAEIPPRRVFEGRDFNIDDEAHPDRNRTLQPLVVNSEITAADIPTMTLPDVLARVDKIAEEMARAQSDFSYARIAEDLTAAGQSVDAGGAPLNPEHVFAIFERLQLEFDDSGQIKDLAMIVHPSMA